MLLGSGKLRLMLLLVAFLLTFLAGCTPAARQPAEIVVYGRQRRYCELVDKVFAKTMLETNNTKIVCQDVQAAEAFTKALAQRAKPEASVVFTDAMNTVTGQKQELWQKLDLPLITNLAHIEDKAKASPLGVDSIGVAVDTFGIMYRTDIFKEKGFAPPKGYADLFRPEFKGRVGLTSTTSGVGMRQLVMFAAARGGSEQNIEPGFAMAKELVESGQVASFPTSSAFFNQAIKQGEIWIGVQYGEAALDFKAEGAPVELVYPAEGTSMGLITAQIPKNAPNVKQAHQFINLFLGEEFQRTIAVERWSIPVRKNLQLPPAQAGALPVSAEQWAKMYQHNWTIIGAKRAEWHERWLREIERKR